jgi:hypothetical protein
MAQMRAGDMCRSGFVSRRFPNIRVTGLTAAIGVFLEPTPWALLAEDSAQSETRLRRFWLRNCPRIFLGHGINPNRECRFLLTRSMWSVLWIAISITSKRIGTIRRLVTLRSKTTRLPDTSTNGAETDGPDLPPNRGVGPNVAERALGSVSNRASLALSACSVGSALRGIPHGQRGWRQNEFV